MEKMSTYTLSALEDWGEIGQVSTETYPKGGLTSISGYCNS
jgi:hypothetical protein